MSRWLTVLVAMLACSGSGGCGRLNFDSVVPIDDAGSTGDSGPDNDAAVPRDAAPGCGNGIVEGTEMCDDDDTDPGDGCDEGCNVELGWNCTTVGTSVCTPDPNALFVSNLILFGTTYSGFEASLDVSGDDNRNASVTLWVCNHTDSPGCAPTTGRALPMTRTGDQYLVSAQNLGGAIGPSDQLSAELEASDPDDVSGLPFSGSVVLRAITHLPQPGFIAAYWNFEGRAVRDLSGNGKDGALEGDATFDTDGLQTGTSLALDGTDDAVDLGAIDGADPLACGNQPFTMSAWFRKDATQVGGDSFQRILDKSADDAGADGFGIAVHPGLRDLKIYVEGNEFTTFPSDNWNYGTWHHAVITVTALGYNFYLDGTDLTDQFVSGSAQLAPATTANARLGARSGATSRDFWGNLDEIVVWCTALNSAEVTTLWNAQRGMFGR